MKNLIIGLIAILLIVTTPVYSRIYINHTECAFGECEEPNGGTSKRSSQTMQALIATGGTHFLQSLSEIDILLSQVETSGASGVDLEAVLPTVNAAIYEITLAQNAIFDLKTLAADTPYYQPVIEKLLAFDYNNFQQSGGLIATVFTQVEGYLALGNVRGVYSQILSNVNDLRERLVTARQNLDRSSLPDLDSLWELNQKASEYKLFGQYVAEVFYQL